MTYSQLQWGTSALFLQSQSFFPAIEGAGCIVQIVANATNNETNTVAECNITSAGTYREIIENVVADALTPLITIPCDVPQGFNGSAAARVRTFPQDAIWGGQPPPGPCDCFQALGNRWVLAGQAHHPGDGCVCV